MHSTSIDVTGPFSLSATCAPVAWGGGRWPNQDWIDGHLIAVSQDADGPIVREVTERSGALLIASGRMDLDHHLWAARVLGTGRTPPRINDPVITAIASTHPGMRPYANESLFDGIITAIIGQSISVQAAAVTERKLAALFCEPIEWRGRLFWPTPTREQLANADPALVRQSGVTQRRADAIVAIARRFLDGSMTEPGPDATEAGIYAEVLALPLVGRWTAESVLLWGLGSADSYPIGDVALLRAARLAYHQPEMSHAEMDALSEQWAPGRSWAARWLWLNLFGPAPD